MRLKQKIYCSHNFIDEVVNKYKKSRTHLIAYKIMLLIGDIYIDLSKEELEKRILDNPFYLALSKKANRGIHAVPKWQTAFSPMNVADEVFFIVDNEIKSYKDYRSSNGCLIIAFNNDDFFYLERMCRETNFSLVPIDDRLDFETEYANSWRDVFSDAKVAPLNAALIVDNYLFAEKFEERKEESLYTILSSLIPKSLKVSFHLTLFYYNGQGVFNKAKADKIINDIKALNLCNDLKVTIVSHTQSAITHDRKILTNYHYICSGKGFNVISKRGIEELTSGTIASVFQSIDILKGHETKKHEYDYTQAWLKKIIDKHSKSNQSCFIAGDNINRLL